MVVMLFLVTCVGLKTVIAGEQGKSPPAATCFDLPVMDYSIAVSPSMAGDVWTIQDYCYVPLLSIADQPGELAAIIEDFMQPPKFFNLLWQDNTYNFNNFEPIARSWVTNRSISINSNCSTVIPFARDCLTYRFTSSVVNKNINSLPTRCPPMYCLLV